jgi:hypothetical protein
MSSGIEAWQICILVTAGIVLIESAVNAVVSRLDKPPDPAKWRTALLVVLLTLTIVVFVKAIGPTLADELASVAAAVVAAAALWLTYRSYQASRSGRPGLPGQPGAPAPPEAQPQTAQPQTAQPEAVVSPSSSDAPASPEAPARNNGSASKDAGPRPPAQPSGPWAEWLRSRPGNRNRD